MQIIPIYNFFFSVSCISVSSAISGIRLSTVSFDNGMSFNLLNADWPNTSLQGAMRESLMRFSPMEFGFLNVAICNDIK